jgi:excisionase family DNA binding protein
MNNGAEKKKLEYLSASEVAARLGVSVPTIHNWTKAGDLPVVQLPCSRLLRYHWPSVEIILLRTQGAKR